MICWKNKIRCLKKKSATFSFSISLSSLLGCDVTIVQYFLFRYILRLECCLPVKAGCTLEDCSHLAEVQVMPQLCILDSNVYPWVFLKGYETWEVDIIVNNSVSWIPIKTKRQMLILAFSFEITSRYISLWLGPHDCLKLNLMFNSVIGYKNSQYSFLTFIIHHGSHLQLSFGSFALTGEIMLTNTVKEGRSSELQTTGSGVKCIVKSNNNIKQTEEKKTHALPLWPNVDVVVLLAAPGFFIWGCEKKIKINKWFINVFEWLYVKSLLSKSFSVHPLLL